MKYKVDDNLKWYKARLVAKRYTQTFGIDYQETFALVTKMNTIRFLFFFNQLILDGVCRNIMSRMLS